MSTVLPADPAAARAALSWWIAAGVDTPVDDMPAAWLARPALRARAELPVAPKQAAAAEARPSPAAATQASQPEDAADVEALAKAAGTPLALAAAVRAWAGPGALLFDGATASGILFITDAPSFDDEREGRLFAGPPGALLDRMLGAIGLDRTCAGMATAAVRPGGDAAETAFVRRLIALERPRILVTLGGAATTRLTGATNGLNRLRGQWLETSISGVTFPVLPTFHPAHLLANPAHKALAWADLLAVQRALRA